MTTDLVRNLIGEPSTAPPAATYKVVHPGTGVLAHEVECATAADLKRAVDTAYAASPAWAAKSLADRKAVLLKAADLMEDATTGFAERIIQNNLKEQSVTEFWAGAQKFMVIAHLRGLAAAADEALAEKELEAEGCEWR